MSLENWTYVPVGVSTEDLGAYQYLEGKETGRESYSSGGSQCTRVFLVAWDQRGRFIDDLLGYSYIDGSGRICRVLPDSHPEISNQYATDCSVEGIGQLGIARTGTAFGSWTTAVITANYKPRPYAIDSDSDVSYYSVVGDHPELHRYLTRNSTFSVEMLTVQGAMKFVTSQRAIPNPPGKAIGTIGLQYVWNEVPAISFNPFVIPNLSAIKACFGKVNNTVFDGGGGNYPPGTVLFLGVDPQQIMPRLNGDNYYWTITFSFLYRDNGFVESLGENAGHNYLFEPTTGWDLVTTDGTSGANRIYQSADLNTLFNLG
ncbi:hypothetical protein [Zavarzinella formosa]|uniref:hypothetical protein n=1 Tax=Zavarzinella formosa TaxID=360055 RepID=UPI000364C16A|nr:hypothetical protein [Zavarzinella formosa]